jgi:UDP-galactopyranose mutase
MTQKANLGDFICFSHLRWNFVYQRPQNLLCRFAKIRRLFYVEYPLITDIARPKLEINRTQEEITVITPHLPSGLD